MTYPTKHRAPKVAEAILALCAAKREFNAKVLAAQAECPHLEVLSAYYTSLWGYTRCCRRCGLFEANRHSRGWEKLTNEFTKDVGSPHAVLEYRIEATEC